MKKRTLILMSLLLLTSCGREKTLICDRGELAGEECLVRETVELTKICQAGYEYDSERNLCVNKIEIDAKPKFICNQDYYVGDGKCISNEFFIKTIERQCISPNIPEGDTLSTTEVKDDGCYEKICIKANDDGTCAEYQENKIDYTVNSYCPEGTKEVEGVCRKIAYQGKSYSCELGTLDGKKCVIEQTSEVILKCDDGYTLNEKENVCERTIYEKAYLKW